MNLHTSSVSSFFFIGENSEDESSSSGSEFEQKQLPSSNFLPSSNLLSSSPTNQLSALSAPPPSTASQTGDPNISGTVPSHLFFFKTSMYGQTDHTVYDYNTYSKNWIFPWLLGPASPTSGGGSLARRWIMSAVIVWLDGRFFLYGWMDIGWINE